MNAQVVSEVAELGKLHGAHLAFQNLVHSLGALVQFMDQKVVSFVNDLLLPHVEVTEGARALGVGGLLLLELGLLTEVVLLEYALAVLVEHRVLKGGVVFDLCRMGDEDDLQFCVTLLICITYLFERLLGYSIHLK